MPGASELEPVAQTATSLASDPAIYASLESGSQPPSLEDILSGRSATPFGLREFERFLSSTERTAESLLFIVWYRAYHAKCHALALKRQQEPQVLRSDPWAGGPGVRRAWEKARGLYNIPRDGGRANDRGARSAARSSSPSYPDESTVTESLAPGSSDELKSEADRAATLFIRSGGAQQLNLDESVRERVLADLARSTHPDVFLPAYEEASVMLETNSLGAFLRHPIEVSPAKRQLWLGLGAGSILLAVTTLLLTVLLLPQAGFGWRALRLISVPFVWVGTSLAYAALREAIATCLDRSDQQRPETWSVDASGRANFVLEDVHDPQQAETQAHPLTAGPGNLWCRRQQPAVEWTWKRGHLPPPLTLALQAASDLLSAANWTHDYAYSRTATHEDDALDGRPLQTWKRGHIPPPLIATSDPVARPADAVAVRSLSSHVLTTPGSPPPASKTPDGQTFSTELVLDNTPPAVSMYGRRGHLPSAAEVNRSFRAAIAPDWDATPAASSADGPQITSGGAMWHLDGRPKLRTLDGGLVSLVVCALWTALCLASPGPRSRRG